MCTSSPCDFIPLAYDVFGGTAPKAEAFLGQLASSAVMKSFGETEGPVFNIHFSAVISKWKARLSTVVQQEVANCKVEGARNATRRDRVRPQISGSLVDLFEAVSARP